MRSSPGRPRSSTTWRETRFEMTEMQYPGNQKRRGGPDQGEGTSIRCDGGRFHRRARLQPGGHQLPAGDRKHPGQRGRASEAPRSRPSTRRSTTGSPGSRTGPCSSTDSARPLADPAGDVDSGALPGPRPVQDGQRQPRPRGRGRAAGGRRAAPRGGAAPGDTVARFGGDEFAVLVEDVSDERGATRVAERIAEALARPFILREREHFVSASIGISIGSRRRTARGADPRRGRRALPRQGARSRRLRDLRRGDALPRHRARPDRERPSPGAPARGARAPLPADRPPQRRDGGLDGGAAALEPSGAWADRSRSPSSRSRRTHG